MSAWLADLVLALHAAFALFAALGAVLLWRWPRIAWLHLPAAAWAALVMWTGWICPLTPLEQRLRALAGEAAPAGVIERLLEPLLYPAGLTRAIQIALGLGVVLVNLLLYGLRVARHGRWRSSGSRRSG
jgi:hypothetical protein